MMEQVQIGEMAYDLRSSDCPRCDGSGVEPEPKSNHPRPRPGGGFDCYECGGEGKVFSLEFAAKENRGAGSERGSKCRLELSGYPTREDEMSDLFTTCWCGYEAAGVSDLTSHQLYCDPHNTAPKVIDDQRERIADLEAQLAAAQAENARLRQNVDTVEQQSARIAELEVQLAAANVEIAKWREACFKARESGVRALMEIEKLEGER